MNVLNYISHKNLFLALIAVVFLTGTFQVENAFAQTRSGAVSESESELELRSLSYLAQQTKTSKKMLDEGKSSAVMRQNYKANVDGFVERMLLLSLKLKTPTQAKNFNQIKIFFAGFEPKLAAQIPSASMSKESNRRMASER